MPFSQEPIFLRYIIPLISRHRSSLNPFHLQNPTIANFTKRPYTRHSSSPISSTLWSHALTPAFCAIIPIRETPSSVLHHQSTFPPHSLLLSAACLCASRVDHFASALSRPLPTLAEADFRQFSQNFHMRKLTKASYERYGCRRIGPINYKARISSTLTISIHSPSDWMGVLIPWMITSPPLPPPQRKGGWRQRGRVRGKEGWERETFRERLYCGWIGYTVSFHVWKQWSKYLVANFF